MVNYMFLWRKFHAPKVSCGKNVCGEITCGESTCRKSVCGKSTVSAIQILHESIAFDIVSYIILKEMPN